MDFRTVGNRSYLIDPRSPISLNDYIVLFGKGGDLKRIAKKVGLVHFGLSRTIIKAGIIDMLKSLKICEPVELPAKRSPKVNMENLNTGNLNRTPNSGNLNTGNRTPNSGNMNMGNRTPNSGNMNTKNSWNTGSTNTKNSWNSNSESPNGMPPYKKFEVHPTKFGRGKKSINNSNIKSLISKYRRSHNNSNIKDFESLYSPSNDKEEFEILKTFLKNESMSNNNKLFKIKNRVTIPKPKVPAPNGKPTSNQIDALTKTALNISEQIGKPSVAEEPAPF